MYQMNFSKIGHPGAAPTDSFESLVVELARQTIDPQTESFNNNNGAGGDGGVECVRVLANGDEYGWQAKYFLDTLTSAQWQQVTNSVKTAIAKHPRLVRYYVCFPRNLSDSRKTQSGKPVNTERANWNKHVKQWQEFAAQAGMNIQFVLWDESSLQSQILKAPSYAHIINYWFGIEVPDLARMKDLYQRSRSALGQRYSEEVNIELPIERALDSLAGNEKWVAETKTWLTCFYKQYHKIQSWKSKEVDASVKLILEAIISSTELLYEKLITFEQNPYCIYENSELFRTETLKLLENLNSMRSSLYPWIDKKKKDNSNNIEQYEIISARNFFENWLDTLESPSFLAGKNRILLLTGPAGSGKSHLLCDFAGEQLTNNNPTLLLLGQNYHGEAPTHFIFNGLNLSNDNLDLKELEFFGKCLRKRVVIIIDAVNEGSFHTEWRNQLLELRQTIIDNPHLCLVISCRSTYLDQVIGETIQKQFPTLTHPGFSGNRSEAARKYLAKFNINAPDIPFLAEELTNPLFLRTICTALENKKQPIFSFENDGVAKLLGVYQRSVEQNIRVKLQLRSSATVRNIVTSFTNLLFPDHLFGIPYQTALDKFEIQHLAHAEEIFNALITEGLLSENPVDDDGDNIIDFSFQRYSALYIGKALLRKFDTVDKLKEALLPNNTLGRFLIQCRMEHGISEMLSVLVPEQFGCEFVDLIDWQQPEFDDNDKQRMISTAFAYSLTVRSVDAFSDRTKTLFTQITSQWSSTDDPRIDIMIRLSLQEDHPWNAFQLDSILRPLNMPDRDALWTTHISHSDYDEDDDVLASPIHTLMNWATDTDVKKLSEETQLLLGTLLLWLTTTTNISSRERAEHALTRLFTLAPKQIPYFIKQFSGINDQYLIESLYATIYAASLQYRDSVLLQSISDIIPWAKLIHEKPDILLRDSLTGIFEHASALNAPSLPENLFPIHKHPTLSPLVLPSAEEIENLREDCPQIERSAGSDFGDFGKYTMSMICKWSSTLFTKSNHPITNQEHSISFFKMQPQPIQTLFEKYKTLTSSLPELDFESLMEQLKDGALNVSFTNKGGDTQNPEKSEVEKTKDEILQLTSPENVSQTNTALNNYDSDMISKFDKGAAQRWVVKHAYEMGWTKKLFSEFERIHCNQTRPPYGHFIERIGKKYERIALAQLLAYLSEQYYFVPQGYDDVDDSVYKGIWQLDYRDRDMTYPTPLANKLDNHPEIPESSYGELPSFNPVEQHAWVKSIDSVPDFSQIIEKNDQGTGKPWLLLADFQSVSNQPLDHEASEQTADLWYRINSCVINTSDLKKVQSSASNATLMTPNLIFIPDNLHQGYLGEYPERNLYPELLDREHTIESRDIHDISYESLLQLYAWESSEQGSETKIYMPSRKLIQAFDLTANGVGGWTSDKVVKFYDPHLEHSERSKAWCQKDDLTNYLNDNDLTLIWLIGGEKRLYNPNEHSRKWLDANYDEFSAFYYLDASGEIHGNQSPHLPKK